MSLDGAIQSALSGMRLAQLNIGLISGNISNANDENYTKKSVVTEPLTATSNGQSGVRVTGYSRSVDQAISSAYTSSLSDYGMTQQQTSYFTSLKDLLGVSTDTTGLNTSLSDFNSAWQVMTSAPESVANNANVISTGQALATQIKQVSSGLESIDRQIRSDTNDAVNNVNQILSNIQDLNGRISSGTSVGDNVTDLQDQLDTAVRDLSGYMTVKVVPGVNNTVRLMTPQGYSLLDAQPTKFTYNGTSIMVGTQDVSSYLTGGKLQAMINMRADSSPATASSDPGTEVIRKLRDQLESVADSFLSTTGSPTTFAAAYNNASTASGELASNFFTGTDRFNITVNANLLNGNASVKTAAADPVSAALQDDTRNFAAAGLTVSGTSYLGYVNSLLSTLGNSSATIDSRTQIASVTKQNYQERYVANTSVNVDDELATLTQVQNSYAVSAHVVSVIGEVYDVLNDMISRG